MLNLFESGFLWNSNVLVCHFLIQSISYPNLCIQQNHYLLNYYTKLLLLSFHIMSCFHRNLIINDLVSNHELSFHDHRFHDVLNHIIFYKVDKLLDTLKTYYGNLEGTLLQVLHLWSLQVLVLVGFNFEKFMTKNL